MKSGSQLILQHDEGMEQPVEVLTKQSGTFKLGTTMKVIEMTKSGFDKEPTKPDPYAGEYHYKSWWNQFREPWLQSEKMTEDEIKTRVDDAWEYWDYKEMIRLLEELICMIEKKR